MFLCVIVLYFLILVYNIRRHQQGGIDMQDKFNKGTFDSDKMLSCRTLYKANGFTDDDFKRPVIGIFTEQEAHLLSSDV